jgi:hypothetical protein
MKFRKCVEEGNCISRSQEPNTVKETGPAIYLKEGDQVSLRQLHVTTRNLKVTLLKKDLSRGLVASVSYYCS